MEVNKGDSDMALAGLFASVKQKVSSNDFTVIDDTPLRG